MSYERTGWVEDEPARLTGRLEVRPAAELGPIIVCLDTSGARVGGLPRWRGLVPAGEQRKGGREGAGTRGCEVGVGNLAGAAGPWQQPVPRLPCSPHGCRLALGSSQRPRRPPITPGPPPAGSMYGPREVVAKAVALECMRGAHRQQRRCYLYAFRCATWPGRPLLAAGSLCCSALPRPSRSTSGRRPARDARVPARSCGAQQRLATWQLSRRMRCRMRTPPGACAAPAQLTRRRWPRLPCSGPGEVMELELGTDPASFKNLLVFLTSGFGGGTGEPAKQAARPALPRCVGDRMHASRSGACLVRPLLAVGRHIGLPWAAPVACTYAARPAPGPAAGPRTSGSSRSSWGAARGCAGAPRSWCCWQPPSPAALCGAHTLLIALHVRALPGRQADVDAPLELSLERIGREEWALVRGGPLVCSRAEAMRPCCAPGAPGCVHARSPAFLCA